MPAAESQGAWIAGTWCSPLICSAAEADGPNDPTAVQTVAALYLRRRWLAVLEGEADEHPADHSWHRGVVECRREIARLVCWLLYLLAGPYRRYRPRRGRWRRSRPLDPPLEVITDRMPTGPPNATGLGPREERAA